MGEIPLSKTKSNILYNRQIFFKICALSLDLIGLKIMLKCNFFGGKSANIPFHRISRNIVGESIGSIV